MRHPGFVRTVGLIAAKDLRLEWRTWESLATSGVFSLVVLLVFSFSYEAGIVRELGVERLVPGVLWTVLAFAGVVLLTRSMQLERRRDSLSAILCSPTDRGALFVGKLLANFLKFALLQAVLLPLTALFFNFDALASIWPLIAVLLVHSLALAELGTLFAAVTTRVGRGEALVVTLLFPAASPIVISAVECTSAVLADGSLSGVGHWMATAVGFDFLYFFVSLLTFEFVLEE